MAHDLLDAIYGCLIGGTIGDALGAPVESWHYKDIRAKYRRVTELMPSSRANTGTTYEAAGAEATQPGMITDDTTLRHYMCLAIVRKGGRITPQDYADIWLDTLNPDRLYYTERIVLEKLRHGMSPWETGQGQPTADDPIMSIAPIGIVNAGNAAQAFQDAFNISMINQGGIERDVAATMAAGVASALIPGATVSTVLDSMHRHATYLVGRHIEMVDELVDRSSNVDDFVERFYNTMLDQTWPIPPGSEWVKDQWTSPVGLEVLPIVTGLFKLCDGDVNECIVEAASFGRDCDTIASILGGLAGALRGASSIKAEWIETCEAANRDFFEEAEGNPDSNFRHMAERLVQVLESERRAARTRSDQLQKILTWAA